MYRGAARIAVERNAAYCAHLAIGLELAARVVAVCLAAIVTLLSFVYAFLAFPQADDLERTAAMRIFTPLQRLAGDYQRIDGRWASLFIQYVLYMGDHVIARYPWMLIVPLVIGIIGCCCAIAIITDIPISTRSVLVGGVIAYTILWLSAPRGEAFYWFPSEMGYWLPIALGWVTLWVLYRFDTWLSRIVVVLLSTMVPALHEVCGGWIVPVLAVTCVVRVARRSPRRRTAAVAFLTASLSAASVIFAPAIRVRMDDTPHQSLPNAFRQALHIDAFLLSHWFAMVPILAMVLLSAARLRGRPSWYEQAPSLIKIGLALAAVPAPVVMLTIISYGLGGGIPARVYDGVYFLLATAAVTFVAFCGADLSRVRAVVVVLNSGWGSLLRAALIVAAVIEVNQLPRFHAAFREIDPAIRNHAVWEQRNAEIEAQRRAGVRDIVVSQRMIPLSILPTWFDITENPDWVTNQDMKAYFHVRSVRLSSSGKGD